MIGEHDEDKHGLWIAAVVECDLCTTSWTAVFYSKSEKLECPHCSNMVNYTIIERTKE
jgi:hypothetical protein